MMRKLTTLLAAAAVALTALAPATPADARHRRDRDYGYDCRYDRDCGRYDRRHRRDDNDDEIAAGVLGLVLGVAVGAMVANANNNDNRQAPPPQRRYYNDMRGSAYEQDYGYEDPYYDQQPQCTRTERQYDRYARRYVMVDVPC